ncbi:late embryogenesis abundant protein 29-like [Ananas comosus]|uniref:Late embryogenesis abundant protein 29-like n=1 Tax=Ananas comosus TaxID=4615 RepID=A0A6P5FXP7_ANACO|nr:late embryogenesis abundant protein 29-like [Ananas comosus]
MADKSDLRYQAGQAAGHAQVKKDEMMNRASEACQQGKEEAGGLMQQTGEQVKQMAQGAADAVKNAVGMDGSTTTSTTRTTTTKP